MRYIKTYRLFENFEPQNLITIETLLEKINIPIEKRSDIAIWWNENRKDIKISYFRFNNNNIFGVFIEDTIYINEGVNGQPHMRLFIALHESKHCDQYKEGRYIKEYYETVVNEDKETFMEVYRNAEKEANDFAINSMREIGFEREMDLEERRLRGNEGAGEMVYRMMSADIKRLNSIDFFDLLKKQVGIN